jgi:uncharacterized protein Usg
MTVECSPMARQLQGYRLATAEILYHMPDHPGLLQSFVWQHYDIAPDFPELHKFLTFWTRNLDGKLHSVTVGRMQLIKASEVKSAAGIWQLH